MYVYNTWQLLPKILRGSCLFFSTVIHRHRVLKAHFGKLCTVNSQLQLLPHDNRVFCFSIMGYRAMFTRWALRFLPHWTLSSSQSWRQSWEKRSRGCWSRCRRKSQRTGHSCRYEHLRMIYRKLHGSAILDRCGIIRDLVSAIVLSWYHDENNKVCWSVIKVPI